MTKQQLLAQAKLIIDKRKYLAEKKAETVLDSLLRFDDYAACFKQTREQTILCAKTNSVKEDKKLQELSAKLEKIASNYGVDQKDLSVQYFCKKCNDSGYVNGKECTCLKKEIVQLATAFCSLKNPSFTFEKSSENNKHNQKVYDVCKQFCDKIDTTQILNVLLTGKTGTGKTYLCSCMANELLSKEKVVVFVTAYSLNQMFLQARLAPISEKAAILEAFYMADVLIVDDLGTEASYQNVTAESLFALFNERMQNKQKTIVCTNLSLQDIRERYEERIYSRLVDKHVSLCCELIAEDKRLSK